MANWSEEIRHAETLKALEILEKLMEFVENVFVLIMRGHKGQQPLPEPQGDSFMPTTLFLSIEYERKT